MKGRNQHSPAMQAFIDDLFLKIYQGIASEDKPPVIAKRGKLTPTEIDTLTSELKTILNKENIPPEKHESFIQARIERANQAILLFNKLTVKNFEKTLIKAAITNPLDDDSYEKLGYQKDSPEHYRLGGRLIESPTAIKITNYLLAQCIQVGWKLMADERKEAHRHGFLTRQSPVELTHQNDFVDESYKSPRP